MAPKYESLWQVIEVYKQSLAKKKGVGLWDIERKEDSSQEDGDSKMFGK